MGIAGKSAVFCNHIAGFGDWISCEDGKMPVIRLDVGGRGSYFVGLTRRVILVGCSYGCLTVLEQVEAQAKELADKQ